jgi:hypothetical protein
MNSASGIQIGGIRNFSPDSRSDASASPRRICDAAIENRIATADPKASQRVARTRKDS